MSEKQR